MLLSGMSEERFLLEDDEDSRIAEEGLSRWRKSEDDEEKVRTSAEAMLTA